MLRDFIEPAPSLDGKSILLTGGTGSFGRAFVKYVLEHYAPKRLIVFSRDEQKHYDMAQQFPQERYACMRYFIGDVRDFSRLTMATRDVDIIVHAAAMKHVPAAEYNPMECINTNVHGAENIVRVALDNKVRRVIALSTDKACSPINLYGASKLASDKIFVAANNLRGDTGCAFSVVRYGNVLGSAGSVLPYFQKLVVEGAKSLPITDPRMTRFWITLDQGVTFVLSSLAMMAGGEIFIPKIPSSRVVDLVETIWPDISTHVVGIRPGEKLHEMMVSVEDARHTIELPDRYIILPDQGFSAAANTVYADCGHVSEVFLYSSDKNSQFVSKTEIEFLADLVRSL